MNSVDIHKAILTGRYDNNIKQYFEEENNKEFRQGFGKVTSIEVQPHFGFEGDQNFPPNQGSSFKNWDISKLTMPNNTKSTYKNNGNVKKSKPKPRPNKIPRPRPRNQSQLSSQSVMQYGSVAASYGGVVRQFADGNSTTRVSKCEYIGDLRSTSTAFTLNRYFINPGDPLCFPWLSSIAGAWEYYKVNYLRLVYKPNCASTTVGTVAMAVDYDMADAAPVNKQDLAEYRPYISGVPWSTSIIYQAPQQYLRLHNNGKLIIRDPATPITNLTDVGVLYVMLQDVPAGYLGELYIEYEVILMNQQQARMSSALSANVSGSSTLNTQIFSGSYSQTIPRPWLAQGSSTTLLLYITGIWLMDVYVNNATGLTGINCTGSNGATQTALYSAIDPAGGFGMRSFIIQCNTTAYNSPAVLTFSLVGNTGAAISSVRFAPYDNLLL